MEKGKFEAHMEVETVKNLQWRLI